MNNTNEAHASILNFEDREVRMIDKSGEPWWVAKDVCELLGISNHNHAVHGRPGREGGGLDDDEKGVANVTTPSGVQEMIVINEAGLYRLILKSKKPEAKRFSRWVTHEVLPSLRKTGLYIMPGGDESPEAAGALALIKGFDEMRAQLARIEDTMAEARREALLLPAPMGVLPNMTNAASLGRAARVYSSLSKVRINAVWPMVYSEVEYRFGIRIAARKKRAQWKGSTLDYAIHAGYAEMIYTVLYALIQRAYQNDPDQRAA